MNQRLVYYIMLLILSNVSRNARTFSFWLWSKVSAASFLRFLNCYFEWVSLLNFLLIKEKIKKGYLIIDDTVIEKPFSSKLEGATWVYSSKHKKCIFGYHLVVLVWTDGKRKFVLHAQLYASGGKSKIELALELLSYARNTLRLKPEFVLFDSWYSAKDILKRIKDYGWYFVTRLKKNRKFGEKYLYDYKTNPYWDAKDTLNCGLRVHVVRHGKKYFATNRLTLSKTEMLDLYKIRQTIEEVNKLLKFLGLNDCQARKAKAQSKHAQCVIIAFTLLEQESKKFGCSIYSLKKDNRLSEEYVRNLCEERLKMSA